MRSNYLQSILRIRAVCMRTKCIYRTPGITRERLPYQPTHVHVQSIFNATAHTAFVLISIIRYPGAGGYILPSRIAHAWSPRDNGGNGIPRNFQARVPDPSFFQIKKRWTLATSDVWWRIGSREALWQCNARIADFFFFFFFFEI